MVDGGRGGESALVRGLALQRVGRRGEATRGWSKQLPAKWDLREARKTNPPCLSLSYT